MPPREIIPWTRYAQEAGVWIPSRALRELLTMLDRVIGRGEGWGLRDPLRGKRDWVPLKPKLLAEKATKRDKRRRGLSARSFRRTTAEGELLGILLVERVAGRPCLLRPAWYGVADPLAIWREAGARMAAQWPPNGHLMAAPMATLGVSQGTPAEAPSYASEQDGCEKLLTVDRRQNSTARENTVSATPRGRRSQRSGLWLIEDDYLRKIAEGKIESYPKLKPLLLRALTEARERGIDERQVVELLQATVNPGDVRNPTAYFRKLVRERLHLLACDLAPVREESTPPEPVPHRSPPPAITPAPTESGRIYLAEINKMLQKRWAMDEREDKARPPVPRAHADREESEELLCVS